MKSSRQIILKVIISQHHINTNRNVRNLILSNPLPLHSSPPSELQIVFLGNLFYLFVECTAYMALIQLLFAAAENISIASHALLYPIPKLLISITRQFIHLIYFNLRVYAFTRVHYIFVFS